jgi:hypothetical protein
MPLNKTVGHCYVTATDEFEESGIRNTVGLVITPLVNYTVTVAIDLYSHILTVNAMLDIVDGGVGSGDEESSAVIRIIVLVIRLGELRVEDIGAEASVAD